MQEFSPRIEHHSMLYCGTFWDSHSLADFWDQTEPAEFGIAPDARRRYLVAIDPGILSRVQQVARSRCLRISDSTTR